MRLGVMTLPVPIVQLDPDLPLPAYAHEGDAGLDLYAREAAHLAPGGGRAREEGRDERSGPSTGDGF